MKTSFFIPSHLIKRALFVLILVVATLLTSHSQQVQINEPDQKLPTAFDGVPDTVVTNIGALTSLFSQHSGQRMRIQLGAQFSLDGVLASVTEKFDGIIKTFRFVPDNMPGVSFVFTKTISRSGEPLYRGIITGKNIKDCFVLVQENNLFRFIKQNIHTLRAE